MKSLLNCKKSQLANGFGFIVIVFVSAVIIFVMALLSSYLQSFLQTTTWYTDIPLIQNTVDSLGTFMFFLDGFFIVIVVFLILSSIIREYFVRTKAIFFVEVFFITPLFGFAAYIFSVFSKEILSNDVFLSIITTFPKTYYLSQYLHWFFAIIMIVGSIALFGKPDIQDG